MTTTRDAAISSTADSTLEDDRRCFACGPENPLGLRLHFEYGENSARCVVNIEPQFSGWKQMLHGGIVATLLDEAMAHAAIAAGVRAVTARLEIRFRDAAPIGVPLTLAGAIERRRGKVLDATATLSDGAGTVYAEGRSRFIAV
jgi:acyl-coenzyme A thioesterase PaaI-like protein